jgi:hypothetical protein
MAPCCFGTNAQRSLGFVAADSNFVLNRATTHTANRCQTLINRYDRKILILENNYFKILDFHFNIS